MKIKNSSSTQVVHLWERGKKTNLARVIGAEIEMHHGGTQESHLAQPRNTRENLPEEGSGLGNIVPATLSLLSEQIMNAPTRVKD